VTVLGWILGLGLAMSAIALVGSATLLLSEATLSRWIQPLVALAAGSLLGGALFHMLPEALGQGPGATAPLTVMLWVAAGFTSFLVLDQLLHWHHCHRTTSQHTAPLTWLLLVADGLHNFLGGLAVGAVLVIDLEAGIVAWVAAALHEIPQELGDFGVLVHGGWKPRRALFFNFLSALTFPLGGVLAWAIGGGGLDVHFLVALGAGNFIYIAAADLLPEIKGARRLVHVFERLVAFVIGMGGLLLVRLLGHT
jgi:zinc and cadmium transporter